MASVCALLMLPAAPVTGEPAPKTEMDDQYRVVDCSLPGAVVRIGKFAKTAGRKTLTRATAHVCQSRGGAYVESNRASVAGSIEHWLPVAMEGDPKAQNFLGELFEQGPDGRPDYEMAQAWYAKAVNQNFGPAQFNLARLYTDGLGVAKNEAKAGDLFRKAYGFDGKLAAAVKLVDPAEMVALRATVADQGATLRAREAEIATLHIKIGTLEGQTAGLVKANAAANAQLAVLQGQLADQRASLSAAQSKSAGDLTIITSQHTELAAARKAISDRETAMTVREQDVARRQADLDQRARQSIVADRTDIDAKAREIADLRRQLDAGQAQLALIQAESRLAIGERDAGQSELSRLRAGLQASLRTVADREAALVTREQALTTAQAAQQAQQARHAMASNTATSEAAAQVEASRIALEAQRRHVDQDRAALAAERARLDADAKAYQAQLAILSERSSKVSIAEVQLTRAQKDAEAREAALAAREVELMKVSGAYASQKDDRARLDAERAGLRREQEALAQAQQDYSARLRQVEQKEGAVKFDIAEISTQRSRLESREAEVKQRELEARMAQQAADRSAADVRVMRDQIDQVQKILTGAQRGGVEPTSFTPQKAAPKQFSVKFGKYHAILIGNEKYADPSWPALDNPIADIGAIGDLLKQKYDFNVKLLMNADRSTIMSTIEEVGASMGPTDNLLIYYAGHGREIKETGMGYWEPTDSVANSRMTSRSISADALREQLSITGARKVLVISDSCFSGAMQMDVPYPGIASDQPEMREAYLDGMVQPQTRILMTSGNRELVADGGGRGGGHSIFAQSLLSALIDNNDAALARDVFARISADLRRSGIPQDPQYKTFNAAGHVGGDFIFVPRERRLASR